MPSHSDHFATVPAYRASDGKWALPNRPGVALYDFDDLPEWARKRLAVLTVADIGFAEYNIGRRIANAHFWLFLNEEDFEEVDNEQT